MRQLFEIFYILRIQKRIVSAETIHGNTVVVAMLFLLCNENLNSFLTRLRKLFKGGNYSREEIIRGNTVNTIIHYELLSLLRFSKGCKAWLDHLISSVCSNM